MALASLLVGIAQLIVGIIALVVAIVALPQVGSEPQPTTPEAPQAASRRPVGSSKTGG